MYQRVVKIRCDWIRSTTGRKVIITRCVFTLRVDVCMIRPQRPSVNARRLAVARLKLRGRTCRSTVLSQDCLGLPILRCQSFGRTQNARLKSSVMVLTGIGTTEMPGEKNMRRLRIVSDKNTVAQCETEPYHLRQNPSSE